MFYLISTFNNLNKEQQEKYDSDVVQVKRIIVPSIPINRSDPLAHKIFSIYVWQESIVKQLSSYETKNKIYETIARYIQRLIISETIDFYDQEKQLEYFDVLGELFEIVSGIIIDQSEEISLNKYRKKLAKFIKASTTNK